MTDRANVMAFLRPSRQLNELLNEGERVIFFGHNELLDAFNAMDDSGSSDGLIQLSERNRRIGGKAQPRGHLIGAYGDSIQLISPW